MRWLCNCTELWEKVTFFKKNMRFIWPKGSDPKGESAHGAGTTWRETCFYYREHENIKITVRTGLPVLQLPDWCQRQVLGWLTSNVLPNTRMVPMAKPCMVVDICDGSTHRLRQEEQEFNVNLHYTVNRGQLGLHLQTRANLKWGGFLW